MKNRHAMRTVAPPAEAPTWNPAWLGCGVGRPANGSARAGGSGSQVAPPSCDARSITRPSRLIFAWPTRNAASRNGSADPSRLHASDGADATMARLFGYGLR